MALLQGYVEGMIQSTGGGSDVTYTPILENGVESGILTIGEEEFKIYSSKTEVTPIGSTGTKIATITIDGTDYDIYSQSGGSTVTCTIVQNASAGFTTVNIFIDGVRYAFNVADRLEGLSHVEFDEDDLVDGDVLTWDGTEEKWTAKQVPPSGIINYSTAEQNTGKKWIDGRPVYQKTIYQASINSNATLTIDENFTDSVYDHIWQTNISWEYTYQSNHFVVPQSFGGTGGNIFLNCRNTGLLMSNRVGVNATDVYITIEYTKVADIPPTP